MPLISDVRCGDWLLSRAGGWATVGGVAGTGFEAYARVFHPVRGFQQDRGVVDQWGGHPVVAERDWRWAEVAARTERVMHPRAQWTRLTGQEPPVSVETADGWIIGPPQEGQLDPAWLAVLVEHFRAETSTPADLVAAVWDGWGDLNGSSSSVAFAFSDVDGSQQQLRALQDQQDERRRQIEAIQAALTGPVLDWPGRSFHLMSASLDFFSNPAWVAEADVDAYPAVGHTPQMLWPADHTWVLATEIDWDTTIVAGSESLIARIVADPLLEAYEVEADDDLSWAGDTLNDCSLPNRAVTDRSGA